MNLKDHVLMALRGRARNVMIDKLALDGLSLSVGEGQRLGVIGHNGAGKSTLLKVLAGVYRPTFGSRRVVGRVNSLFDISIGFEPEATGWENIFYRGYLQLESPRGIRAKLKEIADFSELGEALDTPVRYYSAGMLVRLAFSIATAIEPEILLVDEVLGAGDMAFQIKARKRMAELMQRARLIVLVSHDLNSIREICDRVIWLDHGKIRVDDRPGRVIYQYTQFMQAQAAANVA